MQVGHIMVAFVRPLHRLHRFLHVFGGEKGKYAGKKRKVKRTRWIKKRKSQFNLLCSLALLFFLVLCFCFNHGTKCVDAGCRKEKERQI